MQQIERGLKGAPREANKARVILRNLPGLIQMCLGEDGSLWAAFDARPAALLKKAVGTTAGSGGNGGSEPTLSSAGQSPGYPPERATLLTVRAQPSAP